MIYYFIESSNYILVFFALVYALLSGLYFVCKNGRAKSVVAGFQNMCNFFIAATAFATITVATRNLLYISLFMILMAALLILLGLTKLIYKEADRLLLNNMGLLFTAGMIMISRISLKKAARQMVIFLIILFVCMFVPLIFSKIKFWKKITYVYAGVGIAAIGAVLVMGNMIHGSMLTFTVFGLTFQPSEAVKILFIFFLAGMLWQELNLRKIIISGVISAVIVMILVASRDLGSALIFVSIYVFMLFMASGRYIYLGIGLLAGGGASVLAYNLFSHVRVRVRIWLDPWSDIDNKGYQIAQSLFSISGGGLFGTGLFKGSPQTIPYSETDFIFSAITEELGILFSVCLLVVSFSSFVEILRISNKVRDMFYKLVLYGISVSLVFQAFLTVGGGTKLIPLTGVTLPLVSYGGSSLLVSGLMYFLVQSIYIMLRRQEGEKLYIFHKEKGEKNPVNTDNKINTDNKTDHKEKSNNIPGIFKPVLYTGRKKQIVFTLVNFAVLFCLIAVYITGYYFINRGVLINNSYNRQEANLMKQNLRGEILASGGEVLAYSEQLEDGQQRRVYPYGSAFCHAVGFSSLGKSGIEAEENYYLLNSGENILEKAINRSRGELNSGYSVVSTLDAPLQQIADSTLGSRDGAVIVTEVKTGRILAMVSHPCFDPNSIDKIWDELVDDKNNSALVNRSLQGLYPPGSTFKIFTSYEFENEGFDTEGYSYDCEGYFVYDGVKITCYHGGSHGTVDFKQSFAQSCNSSFANIGMQLDRDKFGSTLSKLLFGINLPSVFDGQPPAVSSFDLSTDYKQMQASIGQGDTEISPYHLNLVTMGIANNGVVMTPYIIDSVISDNGKTLKSTKEKVYRKIMSKEYADSLRTLCEEVVLTGTAKSLNTDLYVAAGKTGSAEYNNNGDSHGWFTGYAPAEDPEIAVTVVVEKGGTSSKSAVPLAKAVFDEYFSR
ncbi:MAG: FtsW/RodA/SpoVE family cell cycle protein [Lachnospiraceae bacterium]|nr:FtsW/RodA/SpoVE family cell cycle protein [Lachnospiraceae bacterium]